MSITAEERAEQSVRAYTVCNWLNVGDIRAAHQTTQELDSLIQTIQEMKAGLSS